MIYNLRYFDFVCIQVEELDKVIYDSYFVPKRNKIFQIFQFLLPLCLLQRRFSAINYNK